MRSVPAGSFERIASFPALWGAWHAYRRGKRRRPAVAAFDLDADLAILALQRDLAAGTFAPSPYRITLIADPKVRIVAAPALRDRVLQRALLDGIGPTYERGFIDQSFAVCSGRGAHRAALAYLGWMRDYPWRLHLDIRHYFASIGHAPLLDLFAHRLRDHRTLALIADLLTAGGAVYRDPLAALALGDHRVPTGHGLPLGGYLSHWSGGLYLDGLDQHVKRVLKIPGYLRYMDDFALFAERAEALVQARDLIADWLERERGLTLKDPGAPPLDNRLPAVFLGFRISRAGIGPGPKALRRLRRRLRRADDLDPEHLARSLLAFRGMWGALGG
ncbi:reverse transcriptase/maturase family protein [uncultured Lamprocystis sp.]|jgi:retron-type reverse transcriptase|uniref:reverse transcriptase/maturase family protein n=1 Tax=uncultured Lamprocystis sp. TaxID=543132 RepID=UPI002600D8D7|nr:reverse transcriptase/maturase family protein [uncultured Lamprocystis sp.]